MDKKDKNETWTTTTEVPPLPPYPGPAVEDEPKGESKRKRWMPIWPSKWKPKRLSAWKSRIVSTKTYQTSKRHTKHVISWVYMFIILPIWTDLKILKPRRLSRKQTFALFLLLTCGVLPMGLLGYYTPPRLYDFGGAPYGGIFENKLMSCGDTFGSQPQNATVSGIESLFVLDKTFGSFTFSQVKSIDVAWDVIVARGVQLAAWWASYVVFSDALLRLIERHPASFRIFMRIALEGPNFLSVWTLTKEVWAAKSKRTRALFVYMFLATSYVLLVPLLLSAMTGYDTTEIAWVELEDNRNNIVPASALIQSWTIFGTWNETWEEARCLDYGVYLEYNALRSRRLDKCDCQIWNGTVLSVTDTFVGEYEQCIFSFPGANQTFDYWNDGKASPMYCNETLHKDIDGKSYDIQYLNGTWGSCYNNVGYSSTDLYRRSRCLPDTANPSYQWGFSTMMSGIFVFLQFAWTISMYVLWQDAQFNSSLVQSGYQMTPLRAAFALAKAAKRRTGMGEKQLVRANTKELEQELYGNSRARVKGTKVEFGIFVDDPEDGDDDEEEKGARRRYRRSRLEASSSEVTLT